MRHKLLLYYFSIVLCLFSIGCGKWTIISYVNLSSEKIWVDVFGIAPDSSPGVLLPGTGTTRLTEATVESAEPFTFDDTIKITWNLTEIPTRKPLNCIATILGSRPKFKEGRLRSSIRHRGEWEMKITATRPGGSRNGMVIRYSKVTVLSAITMLLLCVPASGGKVIPSPYSVEKAFDAGAHLDIHE